MVCIKILELIIALTFICFCNIHAINFQCIYLPSTAGLNYHLSGRTDEKFCIIIIIKILIKIP